MNGWMNGWLNGWMGGRLGGRMMHVEFTQICTEWRDKYSVKVVLSWGELPYDMKSDRSSSSCGTSSSSQKIFSNYGLTTAVVVPPVDHEISYQTIDIYFAIAIAACLIVVNSHIVIS